MRLNFLSLWARATSQGRWDQPKQQINGTLHIKAHRKMPWFICSPGEIFLLYCKNLSTRDIFSSLTYTSPGTGGELWVKPVSPQQLPKFRSRQAKFPTPFYTIASAWEPCTAPFCWLQRRAQSCGSLFSWAMPMCKPGHCPGALLHTAAAHSWFPFYHKMPPTLMRFLT